MADSVRQNPGINMIVMALRVRLTQCCSKVMNDGAYDVQGIEKDASNILHVQASRQIGLQESLQVYRNCFQ